MIGTAVSSSLVSLLGVVGATLVILVLILWMSVIILKVSIVDMLSKLISDYKLEKEKHQTEMRLLREQREKEVEKITEPPKYVQKTSQLKYSENGEIREERLYNKKGTGFWGLFAPKKEIPKNDVRYSNDGLNVIDFEEYEICPQRIFTTNPRQIHNWEYSAETQGYFILMETSFVSIEKGITIFMPCC